MTAFTSTVLYLQQINFCQVAGAAALCYDYLLLFEKEVDLIWISQWNLVTLLYAIVRYTSFFLIMVNLFYVGNLKWSANVSLVWYQLRMWAPYIFKIAMDIILMKRLYALSSTPNRFVSSPRWALGIMTLAFTAKYVLCITFLMLAIGPNSHLTSIEADISGTRVCGTFMTELQANYIVSANFPAFGFDALLFILAFGYFVADVWESWRSQGSMWKANDLLQILIRDSTIYFAIVAISTALAVGNSHTHEPTFFIAISLALQNFLPFCFAPRLVINVKGRKNRVHMSKFEGEICNAQPGEEDNNMPQLDLLQIVNSA